MSCNSRLTSQTACYVRDSRAHTPIWQPSPSPFLLFNSIQHRSQAWANTYTEPTSRSSSPPRPGFVTTNGSSSQSDVPKTPRRVVDQPSCPPAPRRQPPLELYGGIEDNLRNRAHCRHDATATDDVAASLRCLVAKAGAVSSPQDMLCRLRPDTPKIALTEAADSEVSMPVPAMPMPACLGIYESLSALRAKRLKLFGQARSSFPTSDRVQSGSAEVLLPAQSQLSPLTARFDPSAVQTDPPTAYTDCITNPRRQTSGLPGGAVALRTHSESGVQLLAQACMIICPLLPGSAALCPVESTAVNPGCLLACAQDFLKPLSVQSSCLVSHCGRTSHQPVNTSSMSSCIDDHSLRQCCT